MNSLFRNLDGRCPECNGPVNIVEGMVYDYTLDREGLPNFLNSESYKVAGYCEKCKKCLFVAPNSNGGYTVYPDNPAIPDLIANFGNHGRSSALGIRLLESEENPFWNITEDDDCPF
jgi:hypothetical protein